jgi:hypothetical protein
MAQKKPARTQVRTGFSEEHARDQALFWIVSPSCARLEKKSWNLRT